MMTYKICPQCSATISHPLAPGFHCGGCDCCRKVNARGRYLETPAVVETIVTAMQAELAPDERRTIRYNEPGIDPALADWMLRGGWPGLVITRKSQLWNLL
jgi:hypothetical protein